MQQFTTILISIILEAIPFILLGAVVSSTIQVFVSKDQIAAILPRRRWLGVMVATLMGIIFPVCECAIIPIAKRLVKKGVPTGMAVSFMLAVPIVNPVVLLSTYYAFNNDFKMVALRAGLGFVVAVAIGLFINQDSFGEGSILRADGKSKKASCSCGCDHDHNHEEHHEEYTLSHTARTRASHKKYTTKFRRSKWQQILEHTGSEFIDISQYLIFGAIISALFQCYVDRQLITKVGTDPFLGVIFMMGLAFVLSLCSEVDAFIARTFLGQFTTGAVTAFLILGPMIDIKNMIMLLGNFKLKFVLKLTVYIVLMCALTGLAINLIW